MATNPNITQFPTPPVQATRGSRPLARKLAQVLSEVHRVPKKGRNDFHGYDYVYESDLVDHIRDKLADHGVMIFPSVREHDVTEMQDARKRTVYLTTVTLDITLIDGESNDQFTTTWVGQGMDNGDKGYYKAYTGAIKYFLLKTFLISTGDDPENDDVQRSPKGGKKPTKPSPKQGNAPKQSAAPSATSEKEKWQVKATEFTELLEEAADTETVSSFKKLYIHRMKAKSLDEIDAKKIGAMCRKLRGMNADARKDYIEGVVADQAAKSAK